MKIDKIKDLMACKIIDIGRVIDLCWIIFEKGASEHLVVCGSGIEQ